MQKHQRAQASKPARGKQDSELRTALQYGNACSALSAGVLVEDAAEAHRQATSHGARSALEPTMLSDEASATQQTVSEVELYGDVVLRFVSGSFEVSLAS